LMDLHQIWYWHFGILLYSLEVSPITKND